MDVQSARTLLAIVELGSFRAAAERLNVTQSTVSARIKTLEDLLGRRLLERSKAGVALTAAGEQFHRHALSMVRIWRQAQLEVSLADTHQRHLAVGAQVSLWEGLLINWIGALRAEMPEIAISAGFGASHDLVERLSEGTLDIAVVYRGMQRPGLAFEHLIDEELVLVTSADAQQSHLGPDYVFVNWGPEFAADHAMAYPQHSSTGLQLNLGAVAINHLFVVPATGYFPLRVARPYLDDGRLSLVSGARRFVYPVYAAYPSGDDDGNLSGVLARLRSAAARASEAALEIADGAAPPSV